ncbi:MAG: hypothetical protein AB7O24_26300 [Kofleriaceae bacterium]
MNARAFFVDVLTAALELGVATHDDVLRHTTPDILANHLPRPLWAKLLTACLGATRVDARLVVDTVGVPALCEHVPHPIVWACISEIASRALGVAVSTRPTRDASKPARDTIGPSPAPVAPVATIPPRAVIPRTTSSELRVSAPAPTESSADAQALGGDQLADLVAELEADERASQPSSSRSRNASGRFRQAGTNVGRPNTIRRPQVAATIPARGSSSMATGTAPSTPALSITDTHEIADVADVELDIETDVGRSEWKTSLAVEDEQLVDWAASDEATGDETRKR